MATLCRLLIPTDFSEHDAVVYQFIEQAKARGPVAAHFVHILQPPVLPAFELAAVDYVQNYLAGIEKTVREQLAELPHHPELKGVAVTTELVTDSRRSFADELAHQATAQKADFIVTLSKHRQGLDELLLGSMLLKIVQRAPVPTWVLSPGQLPQVQRILFATDFSKASTEIFLQVASLARWLGASVFLAKISTPADYETTRQFNATYRAFLEDLTLNNLEARELIQDVFHINAEELPLGIEHCAEDNLVDAIALATHGRRGFNLLMNGSVTQEVLEITQLPVVVYPIAEG